MNNKLDGDFYLCEVLGGSVDTMKRGAVKVKVLGVTDGFDDDSQPYVYPALTSGMQQVPQKGYFLTVHFRGGDINCGMYYGMSQTPSFLPADYVSNYPDTAVLNMGEDGYFYTHDRKSHMTSVNNPGNDTVVTWDAAGYVTLECQNAYGNSGMGAREGRGSNVQQVLTEGTIDIFTCMPVGNNREKTGYGQGSEYLGVSHISQATVDATPTEVQPEPESVPDYENDVQTQNLYDLSGNVTGTIDYYPTDRYVPRTDKEYKRVIVCHSNGMTFPEIAKQCLETNSSVHYVIGRKAGVPDVLSETGHDGASNAGFAQFIELGNDCGMWSGETVDGEKANVGAVVIMLIGAMYDGITDYQNKMMETVLDTIQYTAKDASIELVVPDMFDNFNDIAASMKLYLTT